MQAQRAATLPALLLAFLLASCVGAASSPTPALPAASPTSSPAPTVMPTPSPVVSPSPALETYVVVAGDSLSQIAAHFGVTVEALLALNPSVEDPNRIAVGQVIRVPDRSVGTVIRIEGPDYRHLRLRENADLVAIGNPLLAGENVQWQLAEAPSKPATWPSGSLPWRPTEQAWIDVDGRSSPVLAEYLNAYDEGEHQGRHVWRAYRGMVPATATHPELWTQTVVVEWGGTGPCPVGITERWGVERLVAPDGTTYDVVPGEDAEFNGQWTIVASNVGDVPGTGWRRVLERCWEPYQAVVGRDATAYVSVAYRTGEPSGVVRPGRLIVAGPEGYRRGRPLLWHNLEQAPDGTVFVSSMEVDEEGPYAPTFVSMSMAALGPDGNPKPGWPFTTTDPSSSPVYGSDGTVFLAQSTDSGDRIIALSPDGQIKPGWPYQLPGELTVTPCGAGCANVPDSPIVTPDGSALRAYFSGIYLVGPDGDPRPGWPYVMPTGTSLEDAALGATPGGGPFDPILTDDGRIYLPQRDGRSSTAHDDMLCLLVDGTFCPGWPVKLASGMLADRFSVNERGVVHVDLRGVTGSLDIRPDGTIVK